MQAQSSACFAQLVVRCCLPWFSCREAHNWLCSNFVVNFIVWLRNRVRVPSCVLLISVKNIIKLSISQPGGCDASYHEQISNKHASNREGGTRLFRSGHVAPPPNDLNDPFRAFACGQVMQ